ncbi:hypothetical protein H4Q32_022555 [Labeo rohita]|uniref:Spliceosome-associated protein CWC27 homolog n=1 Tax=Labeo rohita TaxID=84645 RepID=A0ABQ8MAR6_LABRO|nr:hypothetical protein H4Q32_022555 [Labeo rohita]
MSNIYIQEPPTNGKVLLKTTAGDIDIELWSKETPKACRNFTQLCMEGYYDGTIFHRVVPDFIVQGGDPTGTGTGGESIYGRPFKDEFHSRLRFNRRGLVAMANAGPHDNGSQFFFTLGRADELNNKHTIFGKVTGDTVYNLLRLAEVDCDSDERPLNPHKIRSTEVLHSPFDDIIPREIKVKKQKNKDEGKKSQSKATKNFSLLSFGEEAEEDEELVNQVSQTLKGKSKSSHDLLKDDPKLSSVPVVDRNQSGEDDSEDAGDDEEDDSERESERERIRENISQKLKKDKMDEKKTNPETVKKTSRRDAQSCSWRVSSESRCFRVLEIFRQSRRCVQYKGRGGNLLSGRVGAVTHRRRVQCVSTRTVAQLLLILTGAASLDTARSLKVSTYLAHKSNYSATAGENGLLLPTWQPQHYSS